MRALHLQPTAVLLHLFTVFSIFHNFSAQSFIFTLFIFSVCWRVVIGRVMETGQPRFRAVLLLTQRKALLDTLT